MPNHKSCMKRVKQTKVQRMRNRVLTSRLRSAVKELRAETSKDSALKKLSAVSSLLDQAAKKHLIHTRKADRSKSRLAQFVQKLA